MKINAGRTIKVMKKNLQLTNHEVFQRATNFVNINALINRGLKLKKETLTKNDNKENTTIFDEEKNKKNLENFDINFKTIQFNKKKKNNLFNKKYYLGLKKISLEPFYNVI